MTCPNCQASNPEGSRFCSSCGTPLSPIRPKKGERRMLTVLFADVVGSTPLAETLDPEIVTEIMNGAFAFMNDAIGQHEGTVARLMGDAVMAFFGAPVAHENDPERAIRAGLEIQHAARDYAHSILAEYGVGFNVRVGINTGLVVLATVGDEIHSEYTAMGDAVNVAARLQQIADPGSVLISGETYRLAQHVVKGEQRGLIQLKGKSEPVETFEVLDVRAAPGQGRGLSGITSPLVGRADELTCLRDRLAALRQGQGSLVSVVGEAGLGKSRLIAEARTASRGTDGLRWLEGRALTYGRAIPYFPWRELIQHELGVGESDAPDAIRARLNERTRQLELSADHTRFLEAILAVESDETRALIAELDGETLKARITAAVRECLRVIATRQPVVLVFEDLHWADSGSLDLIRVVSELIEDLPLMIVTVLRTDRDAPSWSFLMRLPHLLGERYSRIWLTPLDGEHSGELLGNLLFIEDLPASIREMILTRSDGNPLFLEEVIRTLIDSGHIVRENGHWRAIREIVNVSVPDTLVGVLSARIDRLPQDTKRVAQVAATIGRIFPYTILERVCSTIPEPERIADPSPHLHKLSEEELVRERAREPELEYIFKHVLTQEAAYNLLLVRTRREYHRRAGQVLEEEYQGNLNAVAGNIAFHYWEGEAWASAIRFSLMAGEHAEQRLYAMQEAHTHFERAFSALGRLDSADPALHLEVVLAGVHAALRFLPREELLDRLTRAEEIARNLNDRVRLSQVLHWIAHIHVVSGFVSRAMPALVENHQLATDVGDGRLSLYPNWAMAYSLLDSNPGLAAEKMAEIAERARQYKTRHLETHGAGSAAIGYARIGEFEKAREFLRRAEEGARLAEEPVTVADFHLLASLTHMEMGEYELSLAHGREGTERALRANAMECAVTGLCLVGMNKLATRNSDEALSSFQESSRFVEEVRGDPQLLVEMEAGMAVARYYTGKTSDLREINAALDRAKALDFRYTVATLSLTLADAYRELGDLELAGQHLAAALDYYQSNQMRPHIARALELQRRINEASAGTPGSGLPPGAIEPDRSTPAPATNGPLAHQQRVSEPPAED